MGAVLEQWAILLKSVDDGFNQHYRHSRPEGVKVFSRESTRKYEELQLLIECNLSNLDLLVSKCQNCFYWMRMGNELYKRHRRLEKNAKTAIEYFEKDTGPQNNAAPTFLSVSAAVLLSSDQIFSDRETVLRNLESARNHTKSEIGLYRLIGMPLPLARSGRHG